MRINLPTLQAYRDLVAQCSANIGAALPGTSFLGDETLPEAVRPAVTKWGSAKKALDDIDAAFYQLGDALQAILVDDSRNEQWQGEQSRSTVATFGKLISVAAATAQDKTTAALDIARRAALPQRPNPQDAAQEARIAGIKSDVLLLTSSIMAPSSLSVDTDRLIDLLADALTTAISDKDALTTWVLAGSGWINGPFLKSRQWPQGVDAVGYFWDERTSEILAGQSAGRTNLAECVEIYRDLSDPRVGVPALHVATGGFLTSIIKSLETWNPLAQYGAHNNGVPLSAITDEAQV
jgi:hypothetical protein